MYLDGKVGTNRANPDWTAPEAQFRLDLCCLPFHLHILAALS